MVQPLKAVWWFLKKLGIELPYGPAIPLLGIYQKKNENLWKDTHCPTLLAALFTMTKIWKQPKCPARNE